jgi:apolipoprotein N-acyltransferase
VWPESALTFFLDDEPLYRTAIARVLVHTGALLVTGGPRTANGREPPYHNTAFLLGPDAIIVAWYDKERLLPFAEYFPLPAFDVLRRSFGRVREFTAGVPTPPLPTPAGAAGVIVCNEALFPGPAAARVRNGADLLLALTNDTWVGDRKYARQAFEMTLVRAVEQRRWLVRASTAGPSAVVDPSGTVVAETEPLTAATLAATVAPRTGLTPYARVGDAFAVLCGLVALAACGRFR